MTGYDNVNNWHGDAHVSLDLANVHLDHISRNIVNSLELFLLLVNSFLQAELCCSLHCIGKNAEKLQITFFPLDLMNNSEFVSEKLVYLPFFPFLPI